MKPTWPLAAREQPRAHHWSAKQLLCLTRLGFRRGPAICIIRQIVGYGPLCPWWEGRSPEAPPIPTEMPRHDGVGTLLAYVALADWVRPNLNLPFVAVTYS